MIVRTTRAKTYKKLPKGIAWFKTDGLVRYGGRLKVLTYFQVLGDGKIMKLDVVRVKIATQASFGGEPMQIVPCTKSEWTRNVNKVLAKLAIELK